MPHFFLIPRIWFTFAAASKPQETMFIQSLSITNYKNLRDVNVSLSAKLNCLVGPNGAGKTNFLDALYYLSFCKSRSRQTDAQLITHGADFFILDGLYGGGTAEERIRCGAGAGHKKTFRRGGKAYKRLAEHIGLLPLICAAPADEAMVYGAAEERRRLMDIVIAQYDNPFIDALTRYNRALAQRNAMLKQEDGFDAALMDIVEADMATAGERVYAGRKEYVEHIAPVFRHTYAEVAGGGEQADLRYVSHCQRGPLLEVIRRDRSRDVAVGYSLHGIHRDDLELLIDGYPLRQEGSQGQNKTAVLAMKLAQYEYLAEHTATPPMLLLDDIFDKLDAGRVERIVRLVSGKDFGQIFLTDTNRQHLDQILGASAGDYKLFEVKDGEVEN